MQAGGRVLAPVPKGLDFAEHPLVLRIDLLEAILQHTHHVYQGVRGRFFQVFEQGFRHVLEASSGGLEKFERSQIVDTA